MKMARLARLKLDQKQWSWEITKRWITQLWYQPPVAIQRLTKQATSSNLIAIMLIIIILDIDPINWMTKRWLPRVLSKFNSGTQHHNSTITAWAWNLEWHWEISVANSWHKRIYKSLSSWIWRKRRWSLRIISKLFRHKNHWMSWAKFQHYQNKKERTTLVITKTGHSWHTRPLGSKNLDAQCKKFQHRLAWW